MTGVWTGGYVQQELGVRIESDDDSVIPVQDLVGLALRRNPKRAHLLVSRVLAKHVPTVPGLAIAAGGLLGALVAVRLDPAPGAEAAVRAGAATVCAAAEALTGILNDDGVTACSADDGGGTEALAALRLSLAGLKSSHPDVVTIGYAETATGLGRLVAESIGSYYIHSTRHLAAGSRPAAAFEEGHSHATSHRLLPTDGGWLQPSGTVVLVDDELSTGSTIINTIRELHALMPQAVYVVSALVDLRGTADRLRFDELAADIGAMISVTALGTGRIALGPNILARSRDLIDALPASALVSAEAGAIAFLSIGTETVDPVRSDRFGNPPPRQDPSPPDPLGPNTEPGQDAATVVAARIRAVLETVPAGELQDGILVLGTEEFISLPLAVADALDRTPGRAGTPAPPAVKFSTTTRSPIVALNRADYAVASAVGFNSHDATDDGPGPRFAYNLSRDGSRFGAIVLMPEPGTDPGMLCGPGSITESLRAVCRHVVVVLLPALPPTAADWIPGPHVLHT